MCTMLSKINSSTNLETMIAEKQVSVLLLCLVVVLCSWDRFAAWQNIKLLFTVREFSCLLVNEGCCLYVLICFALCMEVEPMFERGNLYVVYLPEERFRSVKICFG